MVGLPFDSFGFLAGFSFGRFAFINGVFAFWLVAFNSVFPFNSVFAFNRGFAFNGRLPLTAGCL